MFRLRSVPFAYVFVILSTTLALAQFSRAPVDQQNELPVGQKTARRGPTKLTARSLHQRSKWRLPVSPIIKVVQYGMRA